MCGICGIVNFNTLSIDQQKLKKMCAVLFHRGPDEEGFYFDSQVGFGMRRLAIIDLITGHQPIHNEEQTVWIICNGEIYNFLELRKELEIKHHKFYTNTDVEVIVHLYEEYGINCVNYLRGMFAFALWDKKIKKLFLVRDRIGKKPLFYCFRNGMLLFASEIKSILEYLDSTPEINLNAIDYFLTYQYIPQPITIFKDIYKLPAASYMVCDMKGNYQIKKYWEVDFRKKLNISFEDAKYKIKQILTEATRLRLISDVPIGAFLSGGHDSSIIVGLMAENLQQKVKTFSVGFKEQNFSELRYARIVAKHFGTEHTEIIVEPNMVEILPKLVWFYDQPFADTSMIPSYYVSNVTRKYVKVALNGDGGDENFCGYLRYQAMKLASLFPFEVFDSSLYVTLSKLIPNLKVSFIKNKLRYFKRFLTALGYPTPTRQVIWHCFFTNELKNFIYSRYMKENVKQNVYNYLIDTYYKAKAYDIIDKISYIDINTYLPEDLLVKMDIASMANSLEARSPFLDHVLFEFTAQIPSNWKLKYGFKTKYILKEAFKNFLPKEIIKRPKQGFGLPISKWLKEDLKEYVKDILFSEKFAKRGLFEQKKVEFLVNRHFSGKEDHGYRIFALIVLELWFRVYIDKEIKF